MNARLLPLSFVLLTTGCFEADLTLAVGADGRTRYTVEAKLSPAMSAFVAGMDRKQAAAVRKQVTEGIRDGIDVRALRKQGVKVKSKVARGGDVGASVSFEAKNLGLLRAADAEVPAFAVDDLGAGTWALVWPLGKGEGIPDLSGLGLSGGTPDPDTPPADADIGSHGASVQAPVDGEEAPEGILAAEAEEALPDVVENVRSPADEMKEMTKQLLDLVGHPRLGFHVQVPGTIEAIAPLDHGTFSGGTASWNFTLEDLDVSVLETLSSLEVRFRAPSGQAFPTVVAP